jgi:putative ABC transport system permease protein
MMVVSVRDSVSYTIKDVMFNILSADITYAFENPQRIDHLEQLTLAYPAVKSAEMWGTAVGKVRPAGQKSSPDDEDIQVFGVPLPTDSYGYQLRAGRWLEPSDDYAIVLNAKLAKDVGVGVGDWVTIKYGEKKERNWHVVGLVFDPLIPTSANVPRDVLLRDLDEVGRAGSVWIKTKTEDPQQQILIAKELRQYYKDHHIKVSAQRGAFGIGGDATVEVANTFINNFNFIVTLLAIMAIIIGAVGGIALSGALSLSVMERRTEIGVMRAIGASSSSIFRLFIGEGLILGWLSWLIALPLSLPAGRLMASVLGQTFQLDIIYHYTPVGAVLWFIIITILSILASWLPARSATRISVRESLAYQ